MRLQGRIVLLAFLVGGAHAYGQWLNFSTPGTPRTPDGKPNLAAPVPRTAEGKPDLSGVWMHEITTVAEIKRLFGNRLDADIALAPPGMEVGTQHKYGFDILVDFNSGNTPLRPEGAELQRRRAAARNVGDVCMGTAGIPFAGLVSEPIKIIQAPKVTVVLYEVDNLHRQIFTDGRALPKEYSLPAYVGYSVGHWDGETLVVETAGFNDKTNLDLMGHPHSDSLHLLERFHRRDFGHLDIEMTFDDPKLYNRPFTIKVPHELMADTDIFELYCNDNEKDRVHLQKK